MLFAKALLIACSAAIVLAKSRPDAIVSGALFSGKDTTENNAHKTDIFRDPRNHATAAASILVYGAKSANFNPSNQDQKTLVSHFDGFEHKVNNFPGFTESDMFESRVSIDNSLMGLEQAIRCEYDNHDSRLIARGIRDLVPGEIRNRDMKEWLLSLVVVSKPRGTNHVTVKLVQLCLKLESDSNNGMTRIPKQHADLKVTEYRVNADVLEKHASKFAETMHVMWMPEYIAYFASPKVQEGNEGRRAEISSISEWF